MTEGNGDQPAIGEKMNGPHGAVMPMQCREAFAVLEIPNRDRTGQLVRVAASTERDGQQFRIG